MNEQGPFIPGVNMNSFYDKISFGYFWVDLDHDGKGNDMILLKPLQSVFFILFLLFGKSSI